jgi:phenylacetate-coenzyme A ligase PaaK-like adenylate-forming protein
MALIGKLIKKGILLRGKTVRKKPQPFIQQKKTLQKLLLTAEDTAFGKAFEFSRILATMAENNDTSNRDFYELYKRQVPIYDYDRIYADWWNRTRLGESDVCWRGKIKYFALSSGTSGSPSKYIPITKEMTKAFQRTSIRQIITVSQQDLPAEIYEKGALMIGGSTSLNYNGIYYEGDLSGIQAKQIPSWFYRYYKPGKEIAANPDWNSKIEEIVRHAKDWDISVIVGIPSWVQILLEKIIAYYKVKHIHEIWPHLSAYVHSGVAFEPYRKGFDKLMGKPIYYFDCYLSSEGYIAFQTRKDTKSMEMVLDNGLFYEFVPFNTENFDAEGNIVKNPKTYLIDEVEEDKEYALLLSTCAGAWRYLIGDVVKFTNKERAEIVITGRTKHYISLCGEHLSVDNMTQAIKLVADDYNFIVREFTVIGTQQESLFGHHWYIGIDDKENQQIPDRLIEKIDEYLRKLNDDYRVERDSALKTITATILPSQVFYDFMRKRGKEGGQNKFPRVLRGNILAEWKNYLKENSYE